MMHMKTTSMWNLPEPKDAFMLSSADAARSSKLFETFRPLQTSTLQQQLCLAEQKTSIRSDAELIPWPFRNLPILVCNKEWRMQVTIKTCQKFDTSNVPFQKTQFVAHLSLCNAMQWT